MLVFEETETGVPGENLSVQRREPTNSTHPWRQIWESNPGHIGGRRVLSWLRHPCTAKNLIFYSDIYTRVFWSLFLFVYFIRSRTKRMVYTCKLLTMLIMIARCMRNWKSEFETVVRTLGYFSNEYDYHELP